MDIKTALSLAKKQLSELDSRILLSYVINKDDTFIICNLDYQLMEQQEDYFSLIAQRNNHKPIAKIVGYKHFYNHKFITNEYTLDPRPETELIIETICAKYPDRQSEYTFVDIGIGTGCISISLLALYPYSSAIGIDISPEALKVCQKNAINIGVNERLELYQQDARKVDNMKNLLPKNIS